MLRRRILLGCLVATAALASNVFADNALAQAVSPALAPEPPRSGAVDGPLAEHGNVPLPEDVAAAAASREPVPGEPMAAPGVTATDVATSEAASIEPAASSAPPSPAAAPAEAPASAANVAEGGQGADKLPEDKLRVLSLRTTETQREIENLLAKRNRIRLMGLNYARYVTWSAASAFALGSLLAVAAANDVERDIKGGDYVGASDKDSDGDVDGDDKNHAQRIARTMGGASLVMAVGGVLSSIFYRSQLGEMNQLTNDIETLRGRQKRAIFELDYELRASRRGARLGLIVRM